MIGSKLGAYEITAKLGEGGMGTVWRATDGRLGREVALKLLPEDFAADPERHARFEREAKLLAQLHHPHIASIFGLEESQGVRALVMELVDGPTLAERLEAGPLPLQEALSVARQIAEALEEAHEKGIIHRDLKPANVKLTLDGRAKVLDFGLAKATEASGSPSTASKVASSPTLTAAVTVEGVILGTAAYMAPEQARGKPVDKRADIWAFGVLVWEMLVGARLFQGETTTDVLAAVMRQQIDFDALPAATPPAVRELLHRCLEREPRNRLRDIGEARVALGGRAAETPAPGRPPGEVPAGGATTSGGGRRLRRALAVVGAVALVGVGLWLWSVGWPRALRPERNRRPIRSLAVLPLANLSGDQGQDYFADGMTEALINTVAQVGALSVISRTTVMQFKRTTLSLPEIAKRLNDVDAIIEGSVQRAGNHVKISVQLVRASTDTQLWAKDYESEMSDVLGLQGEVARAIADQVRVELTPGERRRLAATRAVDPAAYDLYLRGRVHSRRENRDDNDEAIALLEQAVAADPTFAAAHAELARAYHIRLFHFRPDDEALDAKAFSEVDTALRLDPDSSDAHLARALCLWTPQRHFQHQEAIRELRRAVELNPSSDEAHHQLGYVYLHVGLLDRALKEAQEALRLNPGNTLAQYRIGVIRLYQRDYAGAEAVLSEIPLEANPPVVNYQEVLALFHLGRKNEARARVEKYERDYPQDQGGLNASLEAMLAADAGNARRASELIKVALDRGQGYGHFHHTEYTIATVYALLGRPKEAVHWLQASADDGQPCYPLFAGDPNLDRVRHDPAFEVFLAKQQQQWEAFERL
jgi:TolB-like protein/Tfp pilus assembly protein PilF